MNLETAMAWMVVGKLNDHFPHPDDPFDDGSEDFAVMGTPGCVVRCGPCGALKWFSDNDREAFERMVRLTGFEQGGWSYWDDETDGLRWDWFESYWAAHKGCSATNGVAKPCHYGEEEDRDEA